MVGGVDRLADVVQQRGQQELLVPRLLVAGQLEHLQAVVQGVALGVVRRALLHVLQRLQQQAVQLEPVDAVFQPLDVGVEVDAGVLRPSSRSSSGMEARSIGRPVMLLLNG